MGNWVVRPQHVRRLGYDVSIIFVLFTKGKTAQLTYCHSLGCLQRRQIRKKYGIEGGGCTDFMVSFCCPCCSAIQNVKELEARRDARPNKVGYQPQAPMRDPEQYAYLNGPRG